MFVRPRWRLWSFLPDTLYPGEHSKAKGELGKQEKVLSKICKAASNLGLHSISFGKLVCVCDKVISTYLISFIKCLEISKYSDTCKHTVYTLWRGGRFAKCVTKDQICMMLNSLQINKEKTTATRINKWAIWKSNWQNKKFKCATHTYSVFLFIQGIKYLLSTNYVPGITQGIRHMAMSKKWPCSERAHSI